MARRRISRASCSSSKPRSTSRMCRSAAPGRRCKPSSAGHGPMAVNPPSPLLPHIPSRTIPALPIPTLKRTAALPPGPATAPSGFPGFEATTWHALGAPAGTPKDVIATLHRATATTVNDPPVRKALTDLGIDVVGGTPEELRAYVKSEIPKWAEVVKASGAKVD